MRVRIRGKLWDVREVDDVVEAAGRYATEHDVTTGLLGLAIYGKREILIARGLRGRKALEVSVHEAAHAAVPDLAEEAADALGDAVSRVLWRQGWRR